MVTSQRRFRRRLPAAIAVLIVSSGLVLGAVTPAGAEGPAEIPGLTDSAKLDSLVVASGTAIDHEGAALPDGTLVSLYVWPPQEVLADLVVGETVKVVPVGFATTAKGGSFELRVSDETFVDRYAEPNGQVSFEVRAEIRGSASSFSFVGATSDAVKAAQLVAYESGAEAPVVDGVIPIAAEIKLSPIEDIAPRFVDWPEDGLEKACATVLDHDYGPRTVRVGEGYGVIGGTVKFTYTAGASSTLGVGVSSSGSAGTFSASGTASSSSTVTQSYPTTSSGLFYNTQFRYGRYHTVCTNGTIITSETWQAKPSGYAGGATTSVPGAAPAATHCLTHTAGTTTTINTSSAYTFSTGASTGSVLGVNLSSKTGFTSTANLKFTWTQSRKLCGTNGFEGSSPGRLVAKP